MILDDVISGPIAAIGVVIILYILLINSVYLVLTLVGIQHTRSQQEQEAYEPAGLINSNQFLPEIAVVVPAYNEEAVIVDSVQALLSLDYPHYEIIVVNDGSTDGTLDRLVSAYGLEQVAASVPIDVQCDGPVRDVYRSPDRDLVVIDKENSDGGKADALNAGLFFTEKPLFCAIDADSLMERDALRKVVEPFVMEPRKTVATGGTVRIANEISFERGRPASVNLPKNWLVRFQVVEYLRAFFIGRTGLDRIGSLLIISGAFGLFKTDALRAVGGYDTSCVTEDMEIVMRLHRHFIEKDKQYEMTFLSFPVVWTEAPTSVPVLASQRQRWFSGLVDTLIKYRGLLFRPKYGTIGLVALPLFLIVEMFGRLVEGIGYLFFFFGIVLGLFSIPAYLFLIVSIGYGSILTATAVYGEVLTYRQYEDPVEILLLLCFAVLENVIYRPMRALFAWQGLKNHITGDTSWGVMEREGFGENSDQ